MLKLGFIFGEFLVVNFINLALEYPPLLADFGNLALITHIWEEPLLADFSNLA